VYDGVFSFVNDYAALLPEPTAENAESESPLLLAEPARGLCKVLCYHPDHSLTLARMTRGEIRTVVDAWTQQYIEIGGLDWIEYVQIFENRGAMMGASNPHPHGQIWATEHIPNEPAAELVSQKKYLAERGGLLLLDYLAMELELRERIVAENDSWVALVPFWAVWPFETLLLPRAHVRTLNGLDARRRDGLAAILKTVTAGYNRVFNAPFPYSMGFHGAPCDSDEHPEWQLHAHFYPPLLRSATIRKFMVGFELLGSPQRDITPESAAEMLRRVMS
jgi:UDPglucose--hexose-1-phosphate uridylyltransferase